MGRQGRLKQGWCLKHPLHSKGGGKLLRLRLCLEVRPQNQPRGGAGRGALIAQSPLVSKEPHHSCGSSPKQPDLGMGDVNLSSGCNVLSRRLQLYLGIYFFFDLPMSNLLRE